MFKETRGNEYLKASKAILKSVADDGGLFIPDEIVQINLHEIRNYTYRQLATYILSKYLDDFSYEEIEEIVRIAYNNTFDVPSIVEIKKTNSCYFLELFHGPTLAFKDIALRLLPYLIEKSKQKQKHDSKTIILTATSGDTGSSTLNSFQNSNNVNTIVFYPHEGVSEIQERQMLVSNINNNYAIALKGNFDDAQTFVKKVLNDVEFKHLKQIEFTSANSINIARLLPQIVYYVYTYLELLRRKEIENGEKINFSIPTGNFGNILAAYLAKKMGLPINKLICASNKNNVLTEFFNSGIYNMNKDLYKTYSPSMDILNSSNLERLLYYITNDGKKVKTYIDSLNTTKQYHLSETAKKSLSDFTGFYTDEDETLLGIKTVYEKEKYLIDPHTAVAYMAFKKYQEQTQESFKTIIVSTAHPYKFPTAVLKALDLDITDNEFNNLRTLENYTNIKIPKQIRDLEHIEIKKTILTVEEANKFLKERVKL